MPEMTEFEILGGPTKKQIFANFRKIGQSKAYESLMFRFSDESYKYELYVIVLGLHVPDINDEWVADDDNYVGKKWEIRGCIVDNTAGMTEWDQEQVHICYDTETKKGNFHLARNCPSSSLYPTLRIFDGFSLN